MESLIALSLAGLKKKEEILAYIEGFEAATGRRALFELSFNMERDFLQALRPVLQGRTVSVHAACPATECFPSLAGGDPDVIEQSNRDLDATLETAVQFGAGIVVVHPGYATDRAIPADEARRKAMLTGAEFRADIRVEEGSICGPGYAATERYRAFLERTLANLASFCRRCAGRGVGLAVENLNPRVGYLIQTPDDVIETVQRLPEAGICLDIGHLWISDQVYGFGFLEGIRRILATGRVVSAHLHSNHAASRGAGGARYTDDHLCLAAGNVPVRAALELLAASGANLVIESKQEALANGLWLHRFLEKEPCADDSSC
jgi:sugar phosphate isomerase/epimerase